MGEAGAEPDPTKEARVATRLLVLDFDGTMTDAEAEGAPFREGYLRDVAALVDRPYEEVEAKARGFEEEVAADPAAFGWIYDGRIVAPATVDPYLRIMPVARKLFDHYGRFEDEVDRTRLLDGILYKYNYQKTRDVPRDGAREVLLGLAGQPVYVVTNSHTDAVQRKIRKLGETDDGENRLEWLVERVTGRAKKYVVDDEYGAVPEWLVLDSLSRPVLLRRRRYAEVLDRLREECGADWSEVVVVGDIFELDLALPLALGARVGLLVNPYTPEWERQYLEKHERGDLLRSVDEIPAFAGLAAS